MQYEKPEVVELGRAKELIFGRKFNGFETRAPFIQQGVADSELDD